ncbi:MAG: FAD:protein FMN transferase [Paracoccaceae bacterium]
MLASTGAAFVAALPACASTNALGGRAFGSGWRLVLSSDTDQNAAAAVVTRVVQEVDASLSPWRNDSEIGVFNRSRKTRWQSCSDAVAKVTSECLWVAGFTDGAFDPTVGPLVARFGFGPIRGRAGVWRDITIRAGQLRKAAPDLTLDFCGIAKGYALDQISDGLKSLGVSDALVELGGEVRAMGRHPGGARWRVGIERPGLGPLEMQRVVSPGARSLATSGTTTQGYAVDDRSIGHLINPQLGRPIPGGAFSVSVLAETGIRADALATALAVMGPDRGTDFASSMGIAAMFATASAGSVRETMTGDFAKHVIA